MLPTFGEFFVALWGQCPFPWQSILANRIVDGSWPNALDLPTASGKTACMDIAIWALAKQADRPIGVRTAPRRIWFVVDRRIVVDEAFDRANHIASKLDKAKSGPLATIADRLRIIGGTHRPLAVACLRGGVLRDDGWARLPSQASVITSTVDQFGSRILFRGYGPSHLAAPIFAGLAANDSLVLLDEAHLSLPFLNTLKSIESFRHNEWAEMPIRTPFSTTMLSATLPPIASGGNVFPGKDRKSALDHPLLSDRMKVSKWTELISVKARRTAGLDPLEDECVDRTLRRLVGHHRFRMGIILNRVKTARNVAHKLHSQLGNMADVVLLTGRLRPLERDWLVRRWTPFLRANPPMDLARPLVLVSTQCIEVGANFSFDALFTEVASLDALRQRFGRLMRFGGESRIDQTNISVSSTGAILIRKEDLRQGVNDPIYGNSIKTCWELLEKHAEVREGKKLIDLGIEAMDRIASDIDDLSLYLTPTRDAPSLLPSHLDLLAQTSQIPRPDPDIHMFLHGRGAGAPEVRVIWRADLSVSSTKLWRESVTLCPPTSLEALSVPLFHLRQWLAEANIEDEAGDVEGAAYVIPGKGESDQIRPVLRWAGRRGSRVVDRGSLIRPNDLIVVPTRYGMTPFGQFEQEDGLGRAKLDLWEASLAAVGKGPAIRIHEDVLAPWSTCPPLQSLLDLAMSSAVETDELWDSIDAVISYDPDSGQECDSPPPYVIEILSKLSATRDCRVVEHPGGGLILFALHESPGAERDLFADDDDLMSLANQEVSLFDHTESVQRVVEKIGSRCVDDVFLHPLSVAARWHDAGKLDSRFQTLLREGDEVSAVAEAPLAKSAQVPRSASGRTEIREAVGLPSNFRHEMLSMQLAERYGELHGLHDRSLVLHLIASHHGYCRPFAPVSLDSVPPAVIGTHCGVSINLKSEERAAFVDPHLLGSGVADRYGRLTRHYGWWGLAYLESILRLGDWYGSAYGSNPSDPLCRIAGRRVECVPVESRTSDEISLVGIDGANPLGFLAAVGTLAALFEHGHKDVRLGWKYSGIWYPVITGLDQVDPAEVARTLAESLSGVPTTFEANAVLKRSEKAYASAVKNRKSRERALKSKSLSKAEYHDAFEIEIVPLLEHECTLRRDRRDALINAVPWPELALGKQIDCSVTEYREWVKDFMHSANVAERRSLDCLASFASDVCRDPKKESQLSPTPFCFIKGSGHQYFLDTVRQLVAKLDPEAVRQTLFEHWHYRDEGLSMRWDPSEARRYAHMDHNPSDRRVRTMWVANLLAYRALVLYPSAPQGNRLGTVSWSHGSGSDGEREAFTWPIWQPSIGYDEVRFLLSLVELVGQHPSGGPLSARAVRAAFRANRIKVGSGANFKVNFSPAMRV